MRQSLPSPAPATVSPVPASPQAASAPADDICRRLLGLLRNLPRRAGVDVIHRLRTSVRRLEAQLEMPHAAAEDGLFRCPPRVARALRTLRKKAGRVRDIDVHLALLSDPQFSSPSARRLRAPLLRHLRASRAVHLRALRQRALKVRPRLERKLPELLRRAEFTEDPATAARLSAQVRQRFLELSRNIPEDAALLHRLRIDAKHLRYGLEPHGRFESAEPLLAHLRKVQQAIGDWHDWATLHELARRILTQPGAGEFLAQLQQRTAREFTRARRSVHKARLRMLNMDDAGSVPPLQAMQQTLTKAG